MKKLLLLALLGLGLGGGVWKAQNPDGTLDDLKAQAIASGERLSAGVNAVVQHPENLTKEITLEERIDSLEQQVVASDSDKRTAEIQALLDETLAENANSLSSLQESLNDRVAPMEDMTVAVAELDSALQDTRARTDASNVRIDAIDRRLELLVRRLDEQTTDDDLQSVQDNLESMRTSVDTLKNDLQNSQVQFVEKLADITEQSSSLGLRLNTLASSANTAAVSARDNDESASVQALSSSIDERLSAIEQRLSTVNSDSRRIATLMEQLETANTKIAELEKQDAQANLSLDELGTSVAALTTVGESLSIDSIQTQIKDQLALAQSQFDSSATSSNTVELEALLETTRNRLQTLEQRVQSLPATSSEADDAMETQSALQAQIAELGQRLEELTNSDPALESTVNDVKKQVERLSAEGFVTQDDLRANLESESIEYKIYFDRNSAEVTEDAARVLNSFIAQEKNRTTGVSIFGFTDRSGSAAYNQQLALQRATNVRSYLIQNGLDFTKVKALSGLGEDAAAAVLPDNADDAQQRVVVLYAAQP